MEITKDYIQEHYYDKISLYKKLWRREVVLEILPSNLSLNDIEQILNLMIKKGYTFLAAYYKYKDSSIELIYIDYINVPCSLLNHMPSDKKINAKIVGLNLGILNLVTLTSNKSVIDGFSIYTIFKNNKEIYIPYTIKNKKTSYGGCSEYTRTDFRKALFEERNGKCYICNRDMVLKSNSTNKYRLATVDHIVPLAKGGSNDKDNCIICCSLCNQLKGDKMLTDELRENIKNYVLNNEKSITKFLKSTH